MRSISRVELNSELGFNTEEFIRGDGLVAPSTDPAEVRGDGLVAPSTDPPEVRGEGLLPPSKDTLWLDER